MKRIVPFLAIILLVAASAAGLLVMNDPAGVSRIVGLSPKSDKPATRSSSPRERAKPVEVADATKKDASAPEFDRKAAATSTSESRRPPKRDESKSSGALSAKNLGISRKGTYVGLLTTNPVDGVPPAELYPFSVIKRIYPDAKTMTVELAIKNASGMQWKTAYVAFRSSKNQETVQFQISDWQIDEIVGLDYTFPKEDVQNRMFEFRVVAVSGDKRESALADRLQQSRRKVVETNVSKKRRTSNQTLSAVGVLGVMGRMQAPVTGIQVKTTELRSTGSAPVTVKISDDLKFPQDLNIPLRETSEERKSVVELAQQFHKAAIDAQSGLEAFGTELQKNSYETAIRASAGKALTEAREKLEAFNSRGVDLATKIQVSTDPDIRKLASLVPDYSRKMLSQVSTVESQVQSVDQDFRIQQNQ